jgi:hypothetical protein
MQSASTKPEQADNGPGDNTVNRIIAAYIRNKRVMGYAIIVFVLLGGAYLARAVQRDSLGSTFRPLPAGIRLDSLLAVATNSGLVAVIACDTAQHLYVSTNGAQSFEHIGSFSFTQDSIRSLHITPDNRTVVALGNHTVFLHTKGDVNATRSLIETDLAPGFDINGISFYRDSAFLIGDSATICSFSTVVARPEVSTYTVPGPYRVFQIGFRDDPYEVKALVSKPGAPGSFLLLSGSSIETLMDESTGAKTRFAESGSSSFIANSTSTK